MNDEFLVTFGSEVKASPDGRFTGYLVRFSSADSPDLAGEFFTKNTDFGIVDGARTPVYFNHRLPIRTRDGLHEIVIKRKIGEGSMTIDEFGVMLDAIIWNRDNYEKAIIEAGRKNKMGWSSGTAPHLVDYEPAGKSRFIKSWPLGLDASLTPMPCEPLNSAISLRSYSEALSTMKFAPIDIMPDTGTNGEFRQRTISDAEGVVFSLGELDLDTHSRLAVFALTDVAGRFSGINEGRLKAGREISEKNLRLLEELMTQLMSVHDKLRGMRESSMPMEMDAEKRAKETEHFMAKYAHLAKRG